MALLLGRGVACQSLRQARRTHIRSTMYACCLHSTKGIVQPEGSNVNFMQREYACGGGEQVVVRYFSGIRRRGGV